MTRVARGLALGGLALSAAGTAATNTAARRLGLVHDGYWVFALIVPAGAIAVLIGVSLHLARGDGPLARRGRTAALAIVAWLAGALWPALAMGETRAVDGPGGRRSYVVHDPGRAAPPGGRAAVLVLHGFFQSPRTMRNLTGIERLADEEGFLVVYPKGTLGSWNDGDDTKPASRRGVDDAAFLAALIDSLPARHGVDPRRVYAIGFSNGGYVLVRHACALAGRVAAFGIVAAGTYPVWDPDCRPDAPLRTAFVLGGADPTAARLDERFELSPGTSGASWTRAFGCDEPSWTTADPEGGPVRHDRWRCPDGFVAHQIVIEGEGHTWPGGPQFLPPFLAGAATGAFDATGWLWRFFERQGGT